MNPLTELQIRASFVNCSRGEATRLNLPPDLADLDWDRLDYLGWIDRKAPQRACVVLPVDDTVVGLLLRSPEGGAKRRRALCAWCEDVYSKDEVSLYVARRSGAAGRNLNSIGTLICTRFGCSKNVRRRPTIVEAGQDPEGLVQRRIEGLRERSQRFAREVLQDV